MTDISRGLRSVSDDTPGSEREAIPHPGGMPDERDSISDTSNSKFPTAITSLPRWNHHNTFAPDCLVCHPSGMKNDLPFVSRSGGIAYAQPPANFCYPSGMKTNAAWQVVGALRKTPALAVVSLASASTRPSRGGIGRFDLAVGVCFWSVGLRSQSRADPTLS
jgi:hypothetical protein